MNLRGGVLFLAWLAFLLPVSAAPPAIGEKAPDFTLSTPEGKQVRLSDTVAKGPVALVVLRGYPGYQCPYCNRQAQDLLQSSEEFAKAGVNEASGLHHLADAALPWIELQRFWNVAVGVRIAVHHQADH